MNTQNDTSAQNYGHVSDEPKWQDPPDTGDLSLGFDKTSPWAAKGSWHTAVGASPFNTEWVCYLFGSTPDKPAITWHTDTPPNIMVRWFMRICLGCTWVRTRQVDRHAP